MTNIQKYYNDCSNCGELFETHSPRSGRIPQICPNCKYKEKSYRRIVRERQRDLKLFAIEYKGGKCEICGGRFHPAAYDFHHNNPTIKNGRVSQLLNGNLKKLKKELDLCRMICANCHRAIHAKY